MFKCYSCRGVRLNKDCPNRNIGACFHCGQKGHFLKDFPQGKNQPISQKSVLINNKNLGRARNEGPNVGQKPQNQNKPTTRRVFIVSGTEILKSNELIQGMCLIGDKLVPELFNLGATHSFISTSCAEVLGFEIVDLNYKLTITTPSGERMVTCSIC